MALLNEGRIDEAIEHFQKSLEIEPDNAAVHYRLAMPCARAARRGHRAVQNPGNRTERASTMALAFSAARRTDEAIEHFQEACETQPRSCGAHSNLGIALDRKGKKDEALEHFRRAVAINPGYVEGLRNLGKALLDRRQYRRRRDLFSQGSCDPARQCGDTIRSGPGLEEADAGKIDEALEELRQALPLAEAEKDAVLVEKIKAEIRRCEAWPWDEEKKK